MQIYFISFTTTAEDLGYADFELRLLRMNKSAEKVGISKKNIITWTRQKLLKTPYYQESKHILDAKMGAGYWLWKPIIINDQIKKIQEGDILIYCDNSMIFKTHPQPLIDVCIKNRGFFLVHFPKKNSELAKRDAFHYMGLDTPEYRDAYGCQSNILIFQKNPEVVAFLEEWLYYCKDARIITDAPNTCGKPNYPDYDTHNDRLSDMKVYPC